MTEIEFKRSVFVRNNHVSGAFDPDGNLGAYADELKRLVKYADDGLYKKPGYFFDTVEAEGKEQMFVFGFLDIEPENRSEAYFDLYARPVHKMQGISLPRLQNTLESYTSELSNRGDHIEPAVSIPRRTILRDDSQTAQNETEHADSGELETDVEDGMGGRPDRVTENGPERMSTSSNEGIAGPMPLSELADFWERYRSDGPAVTTLRELDRFVATVDESLANVGYVEGTSSQITHREPGIPDRGDPHGFDCAAGTADPVANTPNLEDWIGGDQVHWNDLPTYSQELSRIKERKLQTVSERGWSAGSEDLESKLEEEIGEYWDEFAQEALQQVISGDIQQADDGLLAGTLLGLLRNRGDTYDGLIKGVHTEVVDDDLQQAIAEKAVEEYKSECERRIEDRILPWFERKLDELVEESTEDLAKRVIEHADDIRSSRAYRETERIR